MAILITVPSTSTQGTQATKRGFSPCQMAGRSSRKRKQSIPELHVWGEEVGDSWPWAVPPILIPEEISTPPGHQNIRGERDLSEPPATQGTLCPGLDKEVLGWPCHPQGI